MVIEPLSQRAQLGFELAEIHHHVLAGTLRLQVLHLQVCHHAPAVPVQVLALPVVIGQKMRGIERALRLQSVHVEFSPIYEHLYDIANLAGSTRPLHSPHHDAS